MNKRIITTVAKAKELRKFVEPLLTKAKTDTTHSRRTVFSYLHNKEVVKELFNNVSDKIASRHGGYTRIIKLENRLGDNAEMCIIELVDFNEIYVKDTKTKSKTRRSRRSSSATKGSEGTQVKDENQNTNEELGNEKIIASSQEISDENNAENVQQSTSNKDNEANKSNNLESGDESEK
jgi:large subunit ribosomal protein L17